MLFLRLSKSCVNKTALFSGLFSLLLASLVFCTKKAKNQMIWENRQNSP